MHNSGIMLDALLLNVTEWTTCICTLLWSTSILEFAVIFTVTLLPSRGYNNLKHWKFHCCPWRGNPVDGSMSPKTDANDMRRIYVHDDDRVLIKVTTIYPIAIVVGQPAFWIIKWHLCIYFCNYSASHTEAKYFAGFFLLREQKTRRTIPIINPNIDDNSQAVKYCISSLYLLSSQWLVQ